MPLEEVYGVLENDLADVKSIDELYKKLKKLSVNSPMHRQVFIKFHKLVYGDGK
jgi:Flp pilus assembly CpaE family ATPase